MKLKIRKVEYSIDLIPGPDDTWAVREELKDMSTLLEGEEEGEIVYTKTYQGEFLEMSTKFSDLINEYKALGAIEIEEDDEIYDKLYSSINGGWAAYQQPNWNIAGIGTVTIASGPCIPWTGPYVTINNTTITGVNWSTFTSTSTITSGLSWDTGGSLNVTGSFTIE